MTKKNDRMVWGLTGIGVAGTLAVIFTLADLKQDEIDAINEHAVETLSELDDAESKIGQYVPMSYEGADYQIFLRGVNTHSETSQDVNTCYDFSLNQDGETITVAGFMTNESYRNVCTID